MESYKEYGIMNPSLPESVERQNEFQHGDATESEPHTTEGHYHHPVEVKDTSGSRLLLTLALNFIIPVAQIVGGSFQTACADLGCHAQFQRFYRSADFIRGL